MTRVLCLALLALVPATARGQFSANAARRSAVWVVTPTATGSGFMLDRNTGLFMTADHVVRGRPSIRVVFPEYRNAQVLRDRQWYRNRRSSLGIPARVVRQSTRRDLALLQVNNSSAIPSGAVPVRLATAEPGPGNGVHLISGVPTTRQTAFENVSGTVQSVYYRTSILRGMVRARREIHSAMDTRRGNSGAGVLDNSGELVGVHVSRSRVTGLATAVVVTEVRRFLWP
jgi:S1-C subfamily serine protease